MPRLNRVSYVGIADVASPRGRDSCWCGCLMTFHRQQTHSSTVWLFIGCVLLTTLHARVVLADNSPDSHSPVVVHDLELPPVMQPKPPKPRYAGWLLFAYLVPPVVAASAYVTESNALLITGAALTWLAPAAVHVLAGEHGLAGRSAWVLAFAVGGGLLGGAIGVGVASLMGQDQWDREENPGFHRFVGALFGGMIGTGVGVLSWAIIDVRDALDRDESRRDYGRRAIQSIAFSVVPNRGGASAALAGTF
jgi:hypothetical protein